MSFISELKRRNVIRVAAAYGVVCWLLLQISDVLVDALELPGAWTKALIALQVIGLVPLLVFSWVYEMTPEGLKRESEVPADASVTARTARKLDLVVIVLLLAAIGLFATDRFLLRQPAVAEPRLVTQSAVPDAPAGAETTPVIAVLPLKALSDDQEGTFLASGLHDDLLTRLAKLQAFKVISRTSVMEYLDTTKNLRQIGQELGAGFIVEGGLQSIGGRVSINAQLIDADTDQHLWAETFNRELTTANLFDVQAEIAGAISSALHATLSPSDIKTLETVPTQNLDAYRAYLRGLDLQGSLTRAVLYGTIEAFAEAVALDPEFTEAWARLSLALMQRYWAEGGEESLAPDPALRERAGEALARAEALDAANIETLTARSYFQYYGYRDYTGALITLGQAEATAPHNPMVMSLRGYLLRRLGRLDEAADALMRAREVNPGVGNARELMMTLRLAGRCPEALALMGPALQSYPNDTGVLHASAWTEVECGDPVSGLALLDRAPISTVEEFTNLMDMLVHAHEFERAIARSVEALSALSQGGDQSAAFVINGELAWLYRQAGQPAMAQAALDRAVAASEGLPENPAVLGRRALLEALQGHTDDAVALVGRARASLPEDALSRPWNEYSLARVLAIAGANEDALAQLASLDAIARPEERLRLTSDPAFDALRGDPRFAAVLTP